MSRAKLWKSNLPSLNTDRS